MNQAIRVYIRLFSTSNPLLKKAPDDLKGRSKSSQQWLFRHLNDEYVKKAKRENYRARSAYKLVEIDEKFEILKPGFTVVELGAAPGAWTQVCVEKTNAASKFSNAPQGQHIAVDLLPILPIKGAVILAPMDFTKPATLSAILEKLDGGQVDVVLSDMAPSASGIQQLDQDSIANLAYSVLEFTKQVSKEGGSLLVKLWNGGAVPKLQKELSNHYSSVKLIKPRSSRQDSAEIFLLGRSFKKSNK